MGLTLELAAHDADFLDALDDDTTEDQIATALFEDSEHTYTAGRIWHVIHYLLTESPDPTKRPESFILSGGRKVGPRASVAWLTRTTCGSTPG